MKYWTSGSCPRRCPCWVLMFSVRKRVYLVESLLETSGDTLGYPVSVSCRMERLLKPPGREGLRWKSWSVPYCMSWAELGPMSAGLQCAKKLALGISQILHSYFFALLRGKQIQQIDSSGNLPYRQRLRFSFKRHLCVRKSLLLGRSSLCSAVER